MRKSFLLTALCAGAALASFSPAQAQTGTFSVDVSGNVQSVSHTGPSVFQVGPAAYDQTGTTVVEGSTALNGTAGTFANYSSTGSAPTITGGDLGKYGFSLYATHIFIDPQNSKLVTYDGTFRFFAPGYGYTANDGSILEHGTFSATADFTKSGYTAPVTGQFVADPGSLQPPKWPVPVDFSGASPASFLGTFTSDPTTGAQTLSGHLQTIVAPEPSAVTPFVIGALALGVVGLRRKRANAGV